jgi:uncharacterized phage protein (TIGR02218 family)
VKTGISAELAAHYEGECLTLAKLWKITRRDGEVFGFTDHDKPLTYLSVDYEPTSAYDASAVSIRSELNADNMEAAGLLDSEGINTQDIEAGTWDGARFQLLEVNYEDLTMGHNTLLTGEFGQLTRKANTFVAELRGLMFKLQNNIGRVVTASCDADLGDARCGVDLEALRVSGTVTTGASQIAFTASAMAQAADYFTYGVVTWVTGDNAGRSMEVKQHQAGGVFTLQLDMPHAIDVGDTFTAVPGCNKVGRDGDCKNKFSNYGRFRGFEDVPGQKKVLIYGGQ